MTETEIALVIFSGDPSVVAAGIAELTHLAGYRLTDAGIKDIHDHYFDMPDRRLRQSGMGLRLRVSESSTLLTLKGPAKELAGGVLERLEIEGAWSRGSLTRVLQELEGRGIYFPSPPPSSEPEALPPQVLGRLGLQTVQHRRNQRSVRMVRSSDTMGGCPLAELAIDQVTFYLKTGPVQHHEVEIEAKGEGDLDVLQEVAGELLRSYSEALSRWPYGKLSIGEAAEELLGQSPGEEMLDAENHLTSKAYQRIRDRLDSAREG